MIKYSQIRSLQGGLRVWSRGGILDRSCPPPSKLRLINRLDTSTKVWYLSMVLYININISTMDLGDIFIYKSDLSIYSSGNIVAPCFAACPTRNESNYFPFSFNNYLQRCSVKYIKNITFYVLKRFGVYKLQNFWFPWC